MLKTPHAGIAIAARGNGQRRTRRFESPHAAFENHQPIINEQYIII